MSETLQEIIARAISPGNPDEVTLGAALDAAGLVIVPKKPTAEMVGYADELEDQNLDGSKYVLPIEIREAMLEARLK